MAGLCAFATAIRSGGAWAYICAQAHPFVMGRIDPVEYVGVSHQRNGNVRNINHPLCGCAMLVIQKITFPI